jgi:hypothetical protein
MAERPHQAQTPLLDEWIPEQGEEQVLAAIQGAVRAIDDGTPPGFTDKAALLEYIGRRTPG